ncbi:MAG: phosphatase PAP2 family protein [Cyclobacteriaceae bacterium]|nr:phosphatase PAP2 family protein [Cyclobacteriaceae bacterium]
MKRYLIYFLANIYLFNLITEGVAQSGDTGDSCALCKYGEHKNENPYNLDFHNEIPFIIAGTASMTYGLLMQSSNNTLPFNENELNQLDRLDVNSFDRPATYNWDTNAQKTSDILRTGIIILPIIFLTNHHTRSDFGSLLVMGLEVGAITYGITTGVKHTFNRTRPLAYNENVPLDERTSPNTRLSYFSGHASFTASFSFYIAKVMNDYHPNMKTGYKIAIWSFSAAIPIATGYLRVKGGRHFPTDTISGVVFGAFVGWLIPELHKKKDEDRKLSITPLYNLGSKGVYISYRF